MERNKKKQFVYSFDASTLRGSFDEQVNAILQAVRLTKLEVEDMQIVFDDIQQMLDAIWQGCLVKPFGSIVTGLGLKGSDVDCFVELKQVVQDPSECVLRTKDTMDQFPERFQEVTIRDKKIPVVKFFHSSGRHCDVSFSGPLVVEFGELVAHLMQYDHRALPLAVLTKYWSKVHELTGPVPLFPNNAFTILLIFFLQHEKILPPIAALQQNCEVKMVQGWNASFDKTFRHEFNNTKTLYELLGEFFVFYSKFKFEALVVCPYLGYALKRHMFKDVSRVPSEFNLYKEKLGKEPCDASLLFTNCRMCVQDPFRHDRNCSSVNSEQAIRFIRYIKAAATSYKNTPEEYFLKKILQPLNKLSTSGQLQPNKLGPAQVNKPDQAQINKPDLAQIKNSDQDEISKPGQCQMHQPDETLVNRSGQFHSNKPRQSQINKPGSSHANEAWQVRANNSGPQFKKDRNYRFNKGQFHSHSNKPAQSQRTKYSEYGFGEQEQLNFRQAFRGRGSRNRKNIGRFGNRQQRRSSQRRQEYTDYSHW